MEYNTKYMLFILKWHFSAHLNKKWSNLSMIAYIVSGRIIDTYSIY